ncbi:MAG: hypothetical protein A3A80_02690 [Candidatus Terrybacteria bacterium RIFCSPLOWO2_01_FULL_44_24]|nr:MAG: hypothetical protein A3A80_02690 [Candidatus Terrybacteria bacterium RIFCSPLOWO2_01_FULL_44_24]
MSPWHALAETIVANKVVSEILSPTLLVLVFFLHFGFLARHSRHLLLWQSVFEHQLIKKYHGPI